MIDSYFIAGDFAEGLAGAATSTTVHPPMIVGRVIGVGVVYNGAKVATTDVTIRTANKNSALPKTTILALTDAATDVWRQPFALKDDTLGVDIATQYVEPYIADQVEVLIAEADPGDSVDVVIVVER